MSTFCTGVTVVTAMSRETQPAEPDGEKPADGAPVGFTCQSFASLSLDPPLVSLAVSQNSRTWPHIAASGGFCVNVLDAGQHDLCRGFATGTAADRFAGVRWSPAPATGSPRIAGCLAWVDAELEAVHPGGDHLIVVGRVRAAHTSAEETAPLLFYRSTLYSNWFRTD
ncbi:flavin reductase family protein [Streptomyces sp. CB02923]|uniref:flavin reductase family protein n=1 Tax=Streptomyces sp. CB02923 TaxID=1718985 RepID=UPI001F5B938C|nr:flavin reductase family protein [Streptomyces sp. CB02923]